jgi:hypothetical protein
VGRCMVAIVLIPAEFCIVCHKYYNIIIGPILPTGQVIRECEAN